MAPALWVKTYSPGPAIFAQQRVGRDEKPFRCLKLRTMYVGTKSLPTHEVGETAVTSAGKVLRRLKIDELPQLWNVLKGDMSIVGPRPIVSAEVRRYGNHFKAYAATKPGITGLWQVTGRSDCTYDERVSLDVAYVENWSILRDVWIIAKTVIVVFGRKGSY